MVPAYPGCLGKEVVKRGFSVVVTVYILSDFSKYVSLLLYCRNQCLRNLASVCTGAPPTYMSSVANNPGMNTGMNPGMMPGPLPLPLASQPGYYADSTGAAAMPSADAGSSIPPVKI